MSKPAVLDILALLGLHFERVEAESLAQPEGNRHPMLPATADGPKVKVRELIKTPGCIQPASRELGWARRSGAVRRPAGGHLFTFQTTATDSGPELAGVRHLLPITTFYADCTSWTRSGNFGIS